MDREISQPGTALAGAGVLGSWGPGVLGALGEWALSQAVVAFDTLEYGPFPLGCSSYVHTLTTLSQPKLFLEQDNIQ